MNKLLFSAQIFLGVFLLPATLCSQPPSAKASERIYIGVLDDAREEMVNWKPGVAGQRVIRPAFEKIADEWKSLDASSLPAHMKWTIAFDGRNLGTLESERSSGRGLTSFQTVLTSASSIPTIGSQSQQFAGIMAYGPGKVRRPLVAVSEPYFRDPDGWKRTTLPDEISSLVCKAFRHDYPRVDRCKDEAIVEHNWKFPDQALAFPAAYGSKKHSFLAQAHLETGSCGWVDADDDPQSDPWFFVSEDGTVHRIGSFMTLLDAGDYDNDGRSEVIFFLSQGENTDGFVLFDASFKKRASLFWNYH